MEMGLPHACLSLSGASPPDRTRRIARRQGTRDELRGPPTVAGQKRAPQLGPMGIVPLQPYTKDGILFAFFDNFRG